MSPELIGIISVGIGLFSSNLALVGLLIVLLNRSEARTNQRIDRLEDRMERGIEQLRAEVTQGFAQLRAEMTQGFAQQDVRIRNLEQGQAYMSGQFAELKDYFTHRPPSGNNPEGGG